MAQLDEKIVQDTLSLPMSQVAFPPLYAARDRSTRERSAESKLTRDRRLPEYIVLPVPGWTVAAATTAAAPCHDLGFLRPLYENATAPDPASTKYCHSAGSSNSFSTATVTRHTRRLIDASLAAWKNPQRRIADCVIADRADEPHRGGNRIVTADAWRRIHVQVASDRIGHGDVVVRVNMCNGFAFENRQSPIHLIEPDVGHAARAGVFIRSRSSVEGLVEPTPWRWR